MLCQILIPSPSRIFSLHQLTTSSGHNYTTLSPPSHWSISISYRQSVFLDKYHCSFTRKIVFYILLVTQSLSPHFDQPIAYRKYEYSSSQVRIFLPWQVSNHNCFIERHASSSQTPQRRYSTPVEFLSQSSFVLSSLIITRSHYQPQAPFTTSFSIANLFNGPLSGLFSNDY